MQRRYASACVILDKRKCKKTGKFPVKLRVTFNKVQKYYLIGLDLSEKEFEFLQSSSRRSTGIQKQQQEQVKMWKFKTDSFLVRAQNTVNQLQDFSFKKFEAAFFDTSTLSKSVYSLFQETLNDLQRSDRINTASNYRCSLNSLRRYRPRLEFEDITKDFLLNYELQMLKSGLSITTIGIYLRPLRAIINIAISRGYLKKEDYPFGKRQYQIPTGRNVKKALTREELVKINSYNALPGSAFEKAKDFWLFSYLANGMNMKDIALLRRGNIDGDYLRFERAKTQHALRGSSRKISVYLDSKLKSILDRQSSKANDEYLFPILAGTSTAAERQKKIGLFIKLINKYMNKIAKDVNIDKHITTYHARHSFATMLKRNGFTTEKISESLGHSNIKTTNSYLDSFDDDITKSISDTLSETLNNDEISTK